MSRVLYVLGVILLCLMPAYAVFTMLSGIVEGLRKDREDKLKRQQAATARAEQRRIGLLRREEWYRTTEVQLRDAPGYPADWGIRRALVYLRAEGRCEECGTRVGELSCEPDGIWDCDLPEKRLREAHVHHRLRLSNGGDHSLDNLSLLCQRCHVGEHPNNVLLTGARPADTARSMRLEPERVAIRKARTEWVCHVCGLRIQPGKKYAHGGWCAVCERCCQRFFPDVAALPRWNK